MKLLKAFGQALLIVFGIIFGCFTLLAIIGLLSQGPVWFTLVFCVALVVTLFTGLLYDQTD